MSGDDHLTHIALGMIVEGCKYCESDKKKIDVANKIHHKKFVLTKGYEIACGISQDDAVLFSFSKKTVTCEECLSTLTDD